MSYNDNGKARPRPLLRKLSLVVKLTAFIMLIIALYLTTPDSSRLVSIAGKNLRLETVFGEIRKQTGFEFICESSLLTASRPVTLNVKQATLDEVLTICLKGQRLGFNIRKGTIIIFKLDK